MTNVVSRLSATPAGIEWAGREHGSDTDAVLAELGIGADELAQLRRAGVV
jgi:crotonobetainyl-CoA:carnitine CoA-transferase CaiB-like acyl-CoA transferase